MKPITHTAIIFDQSGSMEGTKGDAIKGFNEKVQQALIAHKDGEQEVYISLITFNGEVYENLWCQPVTEIAEASEEDFQCRGATAFRDALGYTIEKFLLTTDHKNPNISYFIEVISDGKENASKHFKRGDSRLQELVDKVQSTKQWTITYMGCEAEYVRSVSQDTNIPMANCAVWSNTSSKATLCGMSGSNTGSANYYRARKSGETCSKNVYSTDSYKLADFTEENSLNIMSPLYANPNIKIAATPDINVNTLYTLNTNGISPFANRNLANWQS